MSPPAGEHGGTNTQASSPMSITSSQESEEADMEASHHCTQVALIITSLQTAIQFYSSPHFDKTAYHTSALTGHAWVLQLLNGHPERICCELGVRHHVFYALLDCLQWMGHSDSHDVMLEEQLAIFLYTCVTGLTI